MYTLITCWNVNKGKIYLEKINIRLNKMKKEYTNWLKKKNGISWGIILYN